MRSRIIPSWDIEPQRRNNARIVYTNIILGNWILVGETLFATRRSPELGVTVGSWRDTGLGLRKIFWLFCFGEWTNFFDRHSLQVLNCQNVVCEQGRRWRRPWDQGKWKSFWRQEMGDSFIWYRVQLAWTIATRVSERGGDVPIVTRQVLKSDVTAVQRMGKMWSLKQWSPFVYAHE